MNCLFLPNTEYLPYVKSLIFARCIISSFLFAKEDFFFLFLVYIVKSLYSKLYINYL